MARLTTCCGDSPHDTLIAPRIPSRQICHHIINQKPCPKWTDGTPCGATWHPEFLQILEDGQPKWIWLPRQSICRTDQRSRGVRHQQGQFCCTDPNCLRSHAPNWLYAELWAFRWWVQHEFNTGLATGYTLNGDLIGMSTRTANLTLATMPYVDEAYYHKFRWHAPIPQPETYGDMIVTAPSRRANLHNEQPRRGRASTPRRHNTPKRHVTPPRPVVIRAAAPPAATPTAHIPNHGFPKKPTGKRTPGQEQNENMPNNKKLELRQKLHRHLLLTRHKSYQLVHQWHPPSTRHANIRLTRPRSQEPLRLSARQPAPQSRAYQPVSQNLHQLQYPTSSTRLPHKQTLTPWHSHGSWSVVSRLHLPHQESQTQFWEHGSKDHRSNSPASCPQHICKACRPSCVKTAVFNWTVNSSPSSHPCFRTTTQSVWAHGAPSYRATWSHRSPAINILIAFSWSPWHPKHRQQTPPSSSFGGTNISCLPGTWHKNGSPIAVRGQLSYPNTYKPFFWRPSTLWNWPDQWDHLLNFANRRALLWPP